MKVHNSRSFVLIDVVAGLTLLATAATALLVAQSRGLALLRDAREMRQAALVADQLVTAWRLTAPGEAIAQAGEIASPPDWHWTRRVLPIPGDPEIPLQELTLELWRRAGGEDRLVHRLVWWERRYVPTP